MLDVLFVPTALLYFGVIALLFVYGMNFFYLAFVTWRHRHARRQSPALSHMPRVTVQLPIYNELYVAQRLIDAAAQLTYPRNLLEVQVLDDSTDETSALVCAAVERWRADGVNIVQLRRAQRDGYKAGALAHGLALAQGEFIAIFDADFIPARDYLLRTLPDFADERVAFVQTRWGHVNRHYSLLTFLQSLAIDAHFVVEQFARSMGGYWFNFNGTAGVWRRTALADAGGWTADTLTEDLDISYRAFLRGWRALYRREVVTLAELPVSFSAYRRQQHRWARGSFECALKLLPSVWRAPIGLRRKVEATLHLTGYGVHVLLCALALLYPLVLIFAQRHPSLVSLFGLSFIFNISAFAPALFFALAQQQLGRRWWFVLPAIVFMSALGAGMMLNTMRGVLQIAFNRSGVFERTPKYGIAQPGEDWRRRRYQLRLDPIVFAEAAFALLNAGTVVLALRFGNWPIGVYAALFCMGLLFTSGLSVAQAVAVRRAGGESA